MKIENYLTILEEEKVTRNEWIKRYDAEHEEAMKLSAKMMLAQSNEKEEKMRADNAEIKLKDANRNCDVLS